MPAQRDILEPNGVWVLNTESDGGGARAYNRRTFPAVAQLFAGEMKET